MEFYGCELDGETYITIKESEHKEARIYGYVIQLMLCSLKTHLDEDGVFNFFLWLFFFDDEGYR